MAVGDTSEAAPAAPAPSPGTSTSTRARSPAPLLCTTAAARAAAAAGGSGSVQGGPTTKQQRLPAWDPPRAVMQRQYLGQPFPGAAHEGFYLPPASDRRLPHEHLVLTYASHTAAGGRMAYNYPQDPGADPLLAVAATTGTFALSLWKHPLVPGSRPTKLLSLPGAHTAPPSSLRFSRPRSSEVITTAEDGACKVHDITQRATVARLACPAPPFAATPVDESGLVLAVGFGRRVGLWDRRLAGPPQLPSSSSSQRQQADGIVTDVAAVVGLPLLFSSSVDGTVKAWDLRRGLDRSVATLSFQPEDVGVTSLQLHAGHTRLLVGCEGPTTYDLNLSRVFEQEEWSVHANDQLSALPFCPLLHRAFEGGGHNRCNLKRAQITEDGRYVLRGADDGRAYLWAADRGCLLRRFDGAGAAPLLGHAGTHPGPLVSACMSPCGLYPQLAFASDTAAFVYSYREAVGLGGGLVGGVELLDDSLAEEAGAEERGGMYGEEEEGVGDEDMEDEEEGEQAWERDRLGLREGECSYGRGYVTQLVYVCETCLEQSQARRASAAASSSAAAASSSSASAAASAATAPEQREEQDDGLLLHGLCVSCAHNCHAILGHRLRNLGEKRAFRCDCGNACFSQAGRRGGRLACSLQREREERNPGNVYTHNWRDRWCYCDGPEALPMVQCRRCKDWYHQVGGCIHDGYDFDRDDFADGEDYLCEGCLTSAPDLAFLLAYPRLPLADRPAWVAAPPQQQPLPQTPPAFNASSSSTTTSPTTTPSSAAVAAAPTAAATVNSSPAAADAGQDGEDGMDVDGEDTCALCQRPAVEGAPACLSSFLTCTGRAHMEEGQENEGEEEGEEEEAAGGCGRRYHPCCLPRGAAAARDGNGEWCCPACISGTSTIATAEPAAVATATAADPSLPPLGWRMQRGLFLPTGWEALLASEEHKAAAKRALEEGPTTTAAGAAAASQGGSNSSTTPHRPAASSSAAASSTPTTPAAAAAAAAAAAEHPPSPDAFLANLVARPESEEDLDAQIRRAVLAGDEARAFRLAMQKILSQVASNSHETRRSVILPSDVERAAEALRGRLTGGSGGQGVGGQQQQG